MNEEHADLIPHSKPLLGQAEMARAAEVIASGHIAQGRLVAEFETAFGAWLKTRHAVAASSGTAALHMVLAAMQITAGDEVILPSFVCTALLNAVNYVGACPVLADIDPVTYNIDPGDVKKRITRRTRAIIVPHMFGLAADLKALLELNIPVIEDCAQAVGGQHAGKALGTHGHAAIFSFYATKMMTTGEGGMVVTASDKLDRHLRDLRDYDNKHRFRVRFNYKMTDLQAALGICQLERLKGFIERRRYFAALYRRALAGLPLRLPLADSDHIFYRFVIDTGRDVTHRLENLNSGGICCARPVYRPLHAYLKRQGYPRTDRAWQNCLSVPLYPALSDSQADAVCRTLADAFKG